MSNSSADSELNEQIYQEACEWLIEFRTESADAQSRERLDAWLRKSPEHVRAYLEVSAIWEDAELHDAQRAVNAEAHIVRARAEDNVVSLIPQNPVPSKELGGSQQSSLQAEPTLPDDRPAAWSRFRGILIGAAASLFLGAVGAWIYLTPDTYATAIGEQRSVALSDGSIIELDAHSRVRVRLTKSQRQVDLLEGQALFQVAHDSARPFLVRSANALIRAVGTEFDVYRKNRGTTITVLKGRVAVQNQESSLFGEGDSMSDATIREKSAPQANLDSTQSGSPEQVAVHGPGVVLLAAGEQVTVLPGAVSQPVHVDMAATQAWRQRRLVFDSTPLHDVVDEFNRYNSRKLFIDDSTVQKLEIIGVFSSTDPSSLIRFLRAQPGVLVIEGEHEIRITGRAVD